MSEKIIHTSRIRFIERFLLEKVPRDLRVFVSKIADLYQEAGYRCRPVYFA